MHLLLSTWASPPGDGGRVKLWGRPPGNSDFKEKFLNICPNFQNFQYFQNSVGEIWGEIGIWGRWFWLTWTHRDPSPKSKLRGDATAYQSESCQHLTFWCPKTRVLYEFEHVATIVLLSWKSPRWQDSDKIRHVTRWQDDKMTRCLL